MKQLLELVFVIFGIIKVSVSAFGLGLIGSADVILSNPYLDHFWIPQNLIPRHLLFNINKNEQDRGGIAPGCTFVSTQYLTFQWVIKPGVTVKSN